MILAFHILIIALIFIPLGVDFYIHFMEWQSKIHIGRWKERESWQKALVKKARLWLENPPTIRKTHQERLFLIDMVKGDYKSATIQTWQYAGLLLGLENNDAAVFVRHHPNLFNEKDIFPEHLLLGYALQKKAALTTAQEERIKNYIESVPQSETIAYRPWIKGKRYVDTLGMVLPYLYKNGYKKLADAQLKEYDQALYEGIYPAHAFDIGKKLPLGVHDWGRGIGWYILGLLEAPNEPEYRERCIHLAKSLLQHQLENGGFCCFVFNKGERPESSGSVLIGLLFLKTYEQTQEKQYLSAAQKVEKFLMSSTRRNGALDNCQGDTYGIGYYSMIFSVMPFAQGLAILLAQKLNSIEHADH